MLRKSQSSASTHCSPIALEEDLKLDLNWSPTLTNTQELFCLALAAACCMVIYACTHPATLSPVYGTLMGLAFAGISLMLRSLLIEQLFQVRQKLEEELAGDDSTFRHVKNLKVHVKVWDGLRHLQSPGDVLGLHCYHGLGANTYTWSRVQRPLGEQLGALVSCHDTPGFGLTERPKDPSRYYLTFNGQLGRTVLDYELALRGLVPHSMLDEDQAASYPKTNFHQDQADLGSMGGQLESLSSRASVGSASSWTSSGSDLGEHLDGKGEDQEDMEATGASSSGPPRVKRVLVGHSMGGACAALEAVERPEEIAALVLVAPAILVLPSRSYGAPPSGANSEVVLVPFDGTERAKEVVEAAEQAAGDATKEVSGVAAASSGMPLPGAPTMSREDTAKMVGAMGQDEVEHYVVRSSRSGIHLASEKKNVGGVVQVAVAVAQALVLALVLALLLLSRPLIVALLRSAVRSKNFWRRTLESAYYDPNKVSDELVDAYRLPKLVKGWEAGLMQFIISKFSARMGLMQMVKGSHGEIVEDRDLAQRLSDVVVRHKLKVLIIHGVGDRLVPVSNSIRLARTLPGAELVLYKKCGHTPMEEVPELFIPTTVDFLRRNVMSGAAVVGQ